MARIGAWLALATALSCTAGARAAASTWSPPATVAECAQAGVPKVAFPSEGPASPTGAGAIVFASSPSPCRRGATAGGWGVSVAPLRASDIPAPLHTTGQGGGPPTLSATGASFGRIAVVTSGAGSGSSPASVEVREVPGGARLVLDRGRFQPAADAPPALAHAYLGDTALAEVTGGGTIEVWVQRYFQHRFEHAFTVPAPGGPVTALAATMDFRSDVLVAWAQDGAIHAVMLRASRRPEPVQVVGPSAPHPQLQALVSDNDHGMVAWSSVAGPRGRAPFTHVYLSLSAAGVRFHTPTLLAAYPDPLEAGRSPGSLGLQRLSTENVLLCYTTAEGGHYVVRAGQAVMAARGRSRALSDPRSQAILNAFAPGAVGEALALWSSAPSPAGEALTPRRAALWADRVQIATGSRVLATPPVAIAPPGARAAPSIAVDPGSDRAVAAWLEPGSVARIEYAVSAGKAGYVPTRPLPEAAVPGSGTHWLRISAAAVASLVVLLLVGLLLRRRRAAVRS